MSKYLIYTEWLVGPRKSWFILDRPKTEPTLICATSIFPMKPGHTQNKGPRAEIRIDLEKPPVSQIV